MTGGRAWLDTPANFLDDLFALDAGPQAKPATRRVQVTSSVPVGERFRECARLAAETTAEESLALQAAELRRRDGR